MYKLKISLVSMLDCLSFEINYVFQQYELQKLGKVQQTTTKQGLLKHPGNTTLHLTLKQIFQLGKKSTYRKYSLYIGVNCMQAILAGDPDGGPDIKET